MADSAEVTMQSAATTKATETLSQFLARILDQLSLSAWLPSAAMVFIGGLALSLRTVLDHPIAKCVAQAHPGGASSSDCGIASQVAAAVAKLAATEWGGALLSIAAVVVLTMLTQAFAFEAIRILEGFWGTSRIGKHFADRRSARHTRVRSHLSEAHLATTREAWDVARSNLTAEWEGFREGLECELERSFTSEVSTWKLHPRVRQRRLRHRLEAELTEKLADGPHLSPDMIEVLEAAIFEREPTVAIPLDVRLKALRFDWESRSTPDLRRRRLSLDKRLRDYPEAGRESPTRLGNIMRHHEDLTEERLLEGFVVREFDNLPFSLQVDHDDQRNRLDLYCTMVFVLPFAGLVAALALVPHYGYASAVFGLTLAGSIVAYRAVMATSRAYGVVLVAIAELVHARSS